MMRLVVKTTRPVQGYVITAPGYSYLDQWAQEDLLSQVRAVTGHEFSLQDLRNRSVYTVKRAEDGSVIHRVNAPDGLMYAEREDQCRWKGCEAWFSLEELRDDATRCGRPRGIFFGHWCPEHDEQVWQNHLSTPGS